MSKNKRLANQAAAIERLDKDVAWYAAELERARRARDHVVKANASLDEQLHEVDGLAERYRLDRDEARHNAEVLGAECDALHLRLDDISKLAGMALIIKQLEAAS